MKIKQMLCATAAIALLGAGCSDEEAAGKGDLSLSIQISSAVNAITTVHVMGAKGDAKAEALAQIAVDDSLLLAEVLADLPAGTYTLTIDGYVADATAPLATTSAEVTIKADAVATAVLVLGPKPELLATITASNTAPKTGETVTFSATVSGPGAEGAALIWSDDCDGDFLTNGSATVQWSSRLPDGCTVTLAASTPEAATTATLDLGVSLAKGTISLTVGSGACSAPTYYGATAAQYDETHGWKLKGTETARNFPLTQLNGLGIDASGNLLIPERNAARLWRYNPGTDVMAHIAGAPDPFNDSGSYSGDAGPATMATLGELWDVDVAPNGDIYLIDDGYFSGLQEVRLIYAATLTVSTLPSGCNSGYCVGIDVDSDDNVFVTRGSGGDLNKIYANTLTMYSSFAGENAWDVESYGDYIYFTDRWDSSVWRQARSGGNPVRIAGAYEDYNGDWIDGFSGDGGYAASAALNQPRGLFVDQSNGNIFVADNGNQTIRMITQAGMISTAVNVRTQVADVVLDAAKNIYYTDRKSCSVYRVQGPY